MHLVFKLYVKEQCVPCADTREDHFGILGIIINSFAEVEFTLLNLKGTLNDLINLELRKLRPRGSLRFPQERDRSRIFTLVFSSLAPQMNVHRVNGYLSFTKERKISRITEALPLIEC